MRRAITVIAAIWAAVSTALWFRRRFHKGREQAGPSTDGTGGPV